MRMIVTVLLAWVLATPVWADDNPRWTIGFSQATTTEPWRLLFNKNLRDEAERHPEVDLLVRDGRDEVARQAAHVREFIEQGVDAILISPKVAEGLTEVVNQAHDAGIPVFVLDRDLANDGYTQFIGGDNVLIGREAGRYAVDLLGGPGAAQGNVLEIWGGMGTPPSHDRSRGFHEVVDREPGITVLNPPHDADWKQDLAYDFMAEALERYPEIDLVYAHNDPMAYGAWLAARDAGRAKDMAFLGVDGIPVEGVRWVHEGILTATFLYETPGAEGLRQALALLSGETVPERVTLPTLTIDKSNAEDILRQNQILD